MRPPTAKQREEGVFEVFLDLLKRHLELLQRGLVDLVDYLDQLRLRRREIGDLRQQKVVALLQLRVFFDGDEVDRTHAVEPLPERIRLRLGCGPVRRFERRQILLRRLALGVLFLTPTLRCLRSIFRALHRRLRALRPFVFVLVEVEHLDALGLIIGMPELLLPIDLADVGLELARHFFHEEQHPLPVLRQLDFVRAQLTAGNIRFLPHAHLRRLQSVDPPLHVHEPDAHRLHLFLGD